MQVSEVIGFRKEFARYEADQSLPLPMELIGVEVELERTQNMMTPDETFWSTVSDGSLRNNGKEFVFREPLYGVAIGQALMNLQAHIDGGRPEASERCSVHVHINISDMTTAQLHKMLMLYLIFERTLVRYHNGTRENNIFCVPFYKAPRDIALIDSLFAENTRQMDNMFSKFNKYYAINLQAIQEFGSLEFRHMGGSLNMNEVLIWIKIIMCLKKASLDSNYNPYTLITNISGRGPRTTFYEIFGELASLMDYNSLEEDLLRGTRLAQLTVIDKELQGVNDYYSELDVSDFSQNLIDTTLNEVKSRSLKFTLFGPEEGDV